jgi:hypothetical protein
MATFMDKFMVKKAVDFIPAWEYNYVETFGETEYEINDVYGFMTIENSFNGISVEGRVITMGDRDISVRVLSHAETSFKDADMDGKLPIRYCVRQHDGNYARFMCGLDLCENGMVWVCLEGNGCFFSNINNALYYLKNRLGEFQIHTEEPMQKSTWGQ